MRMPRTFPLWLVLLGAPAEAPAQATAPADSPPPAVPGAGAAGQAPAKAFVDLSHRYRFTEQYAAADVPSATASIGAYRVAVVETIKESADGAEAAAKPTSIERRVEYAERPAEVSGLGAVNATIRSYSRYQPRPEEASQGLGPRLLEGLSVWLRPQRDAPPQLVSLDPRRLREREYELISRHVYMPGLAPLLPASAVRIGDTWRVPHKAVQSLLGEPAVRGELVNARFVELRRPEAGPGLLAVFAVTGRVPSPVAETLINAEVLFSFAPARPDPARSAGGGPPADDSLVDARGAIVEVRMARVSKGVLPASAQGRPRPFRIEQQLILDRKLGGPVPVVRGDPPSEAPAATMANSWLTYTDPAGRFSFQHPQELLPPPRGQAQLFAGSDAVFLTKGTPGSNAVDLVEIELFADRRDPPALKAVLKARWDQTKAEVLAGAEEWLPALDWPGVKVFRIEAALKPTLRGPRAPRIHFDAYLIQLTDRATVMAIATTTRENVPSYRRDVEQILKTFRLGPNG